MKKITEKMVYEGQWLSVIESVYETREGESIVWESIQRKKSTLGVVCLAKLVPSNRFVLIKQFRPAAQGYVLGLPAGLANGDPNHALVELMEETGYAGSIVKVSPTLKTGSTITNENGVMVCIEIDENHPPNRNPQQALEPGEVIEVFAVKADEMIGFFEKERAQGTHISSGLWYLFGLGDFLK